MGSLEEVHKVVAYICRLSHQPNSAKSPVFSRAYHMWLDLLGLQVAVYVLHKGLNRTVVETRSPERIVIQITLISKTI